MNCIIIDDDKLSRKVVEEYVGRTETLKLLYSFTNAVDAINALKNSEDEVHLVFLDIEMPEMTGIEFLNSLKDHPQIIIISAKEKYALEAFEYDVTDYLLKPISYARFFKAVDKSQKRHDEIRNTKYSKIEREGSDEIFIKKNSTLVRLKYDDILYVEALENYVIVATFHDKFTIHFTMKAIEDRLPLRKFKRVHRSFIVNINRIKGIEDNAVIIKMDDGTKIIPIGKSYKEKLMNEINLMVK